MGVNLNLKLGGSVCHTSHMSFEDDLLQRSAETYADFLAPHIENDSRVLDCGCGSGSISVGLGELARHGTVIGVDLQAPYRQSRWG